MTRDARDEGWDERELEAFGDDGSYTSDDLFGILHSVLGGSRSDGSIDYGMSDGSFGRYEDAFSDSAGSINKGEGEGEYPSIEGDENLADARGEKSLESEGRAKELDNPATRELVSAVAVPRRSGTDEAHDRNSCGVIPKTLLKCTTEGRTGHEEDDSSDSEGCDEDDSADAKLGSPHSDNAYPTRRVDNDENDTHSNTKPLFQSARWPNRQSVQASIGYMFHAAEAGDSQVGTAHEPRTREERGRRKSQQDRRRRRGNRSPKTVGEKKGVDDDERSDDGSNGNYPASSSGGRWPKSSSAPPGRQCDSFRDDCGDGRTETATTATGNIPRAWQGIRKKTKKSYRRRRRSTYSGGRRSWDESLQVQPTTRNRRSRRSTERDTSGKGRSDGGGTSEKHGVSDGGGTSEKHGCCSGGLLFLENDVREAMIAVWLAWGVRIDAAREQLGREENRLQMAHRADTAKLRRQSHKGGGRGQGGITSEVLDCIAKEGALRELGESELADGTREEALLARRRNLERIQSAMDLRKPMLETALRKQQEAELLAVRGSAEAIESKLARARDETMRLLKVHLSRARRLILAGGLNTAPRARKGRKGIRPEGSLMLREGDLLKLGTVLLLAQETANDSIERALRRPKTAQARGAGNPAGGTASIAVGGALAVEDAQKSGARASAYPGSRSGKTFAFPRRDRHANVNRTDAVTDTAAAAGAAALAPKETSCLWCNPASPSIRQRLHHVASVAKIKDSHRHNIRQPFASRRQGGAVRVRQPLLARQPGRLKTENDDLSPSCTDSDANNQPPPPRMRERAPRRRRSESAPPQPTPFASPEYAADGAAEIDEQGRTTPLAGLCRDPISFVEDRLSGQQEQQEQVDHLGWCSTSPGPFFCSWECAGRWNSKFSPVQARHERGLRIDLAAGRIVGR